MVSDPASDKIFEEFILKESPEKKSTKSKSKENDKDSKKSEKRKEVESSNKLKVAGVENDLKAKLLKKQEERKNSKNPYSKKFFIKLFRIAGVPREECEEIAKKENVLSTLFELWRELID